jgi:hypothetical protein
MLIEPFIEIRGEHRSFWLRKPRRIGDRFLIARKGSLVPASDRDKAVIFLSVKRLRDGGAWYHGRVPPGA